ncbi:MAG: protein kinase domain-containing protein [Syntrophobacteria bacterium]
MLQAEPIRFGKYLLLNKIAVGGMAELYQAKITSVEGFEKLVAIKKILPHLAQDKNLVHMFIDEAKLAAMLTHHNIVQIYDLGSMEDTYFIAMEYIHGMNLRNIRNKAQQKEPPLPPEYALYITGRICAGLAFAHNLKDFQGNPLGFIHRDISPQNILVTYEGEVKIVDFGIAKAAKRRSDTQVGMLKGKVAYMSPQQAAGKPIDHRSDIFATGILLYEMITGRRMFEGSDLEILDQVRKAEFEPPERIVTGLHPKIYEVLHRALAKQLELRYQSCDAMLADVEECLSTFSVRPGAHNLAQYMKNLFAEEIAAETHALQRSETQILPDRAEGAEETSTPQPESEQTLTYNGAPLWSRRRLWFGILSVAGVVLGLYLAFSLRQHSTPAPVTASHRVPAVSSPGKNPVASTPPPTTQSTPRGGPNATEPEQTKREQAMQALEKEQFAGAVQLFEEALARNPSDEPEIADYYARALRGHARALLTDKPREAELLLRKALELAPGNASAHHFLGKIYASRKNYARAVEAYTKALDLNPRFPDTFFNLGIVYAKIEEFTKAEEMFRKVVALSPVYLDEAYFNLAMVQRRQGKKRLCRRNLEKALTVNPGNGKVNMALQDLKEQSEGIP